MIWWYLCKSSRQRRSPIAAATSVDATISTNMMVASRRREAGPRTRIGRVCATGIDRTNARVMIGRATHLADASGRSALPETMVLRVQAAVVDVAPELEIGEDGPPAICPVQPVVWHAQLGRRRAAWAHAVAIAQVQRLPQPPGHRARAAADVEDTALVVHQDRRDRGVVREATGGLTRNTPSPGFAGYSPDFAGERPPVKLGQARARLEPERGEVGGQQKMRLLAAPLGQVARIQPAPGQLHDGVGAALGRRTFVVAGRAGAEKAPDGGLQGGSTFGVEHPSIR